MFYAWGDTFDAAAFIRSFDLPWVSGYTNKGFILDDAAGHNAIAYSPEGYMELPISEQINCALDFFTVNEGVLTTLKSESVQMLLTLRCQTNIDRNNPESVFKSFLFEETFLNATKHFLTDIDVGVGVDVYDFNELPPSARSQISIG